MSAIYERQYQRLTDLVGRVTYKPDWSIDVWRNATVGGVNVGEALAIRVVASFPDSRGGADPVQVTTAEVFSAYLIEEATDERLCERIIDLLTRAEMHERDEWFRLDGALKYDPHR